MEHGRPAFSDSHRSCAKPAPNMVSAAEPPNTVNLARKRVGQA
ncbi:MAG: hypothetical protein RLZZ522_471, partial [Verrucomicrobiota bacterium]